MRMTAVFWFFLVLGSYQALPACAQDQEDSNDLIVRMTTELDLQPDQVFHITPVIQKYDLEFKSLEDGIRSGTMNPSAIASQRQGIEDQETQEISQYLKPYQLSEWRQMQAQMEQKGAGDEDEAGADEYSNLPNGPKQ